MTIFATEFPVTRSVCNRAAFVAQVVTWLKGISSSRIFEEPRYTDLDSDNSYLRATNGEELRLRELSRDGKLEAIGFRHDLPDNDARIWRTEATVKCALDADGQNLLRLRTQCIARDHRAFLETPRKPFLIKRFLEDRWGGQDVALKVSNGPIWLTPDSPSLDLARAITRGEATRNLPVIYVSATGSSTWLLSLDQLYKIAFDVGGVAHLVVEPNRDFSFALRDLTAGANAYGGTLAIAIPGRGIVRQFYLGWRLPNVSDIVEAIRAGVHSIRTQMPAEGWDWTELQEQALRLQRERDRNRLSTQETENLYQQEIINLQERISQLEAQLAARAPEDAIQNDDALLPTSLTDRIGPQIYNGEISDRIRWSAKECLTRADQIGLDNRSKAILGAIVSNLPSSPGLAEFREDLKRATKDSARLAEQLTSLLIRHGYQKKSDKKHIKLEAKAEFAGLENITISKTPSDYRGLENMRKDIEKILGITKLSN